VKAVVVYDSLYGNTERLAQALARGIAGGGVEADAFKVDGLDVERLARYDLIAVGGPTHMAGASKPMKRLLTDMRTVDLRGRKGFCFDTRNESRFNAFDINGAGKRIEGRMKRMKVEMLKPRASATVEGREGPLEEGALKRFQEMGVELARLLKEDDSER
jgi:flavodoxin